MDTDARKSGGSRAGRLWPAALLAACGLAAAQVAAPAAPAPPVASRPGLGLEVHGDAKPEAIGLAVYPGAVRKPPADDDPPGFNLGLWAGRFGLRLNVLPYHSADPIALVAAFYLRDLARYGAVLDCARPEAPRAPASAATPGSSSSLVCDDSELPARGSIVYKVGRPGDQRVVTLRRAGSGTDFQLVRVEGFTGQ